MICSTIMALLLLPDIEITALTLPRSTTEGLRRASRGGWGHGGDLRAGEARREGVEDLQVSKLPWLRTGALHLCHICSLTHMCVCVCVKLGHSWIPAVLCEVSLSCLHTTLPSKRHTPTQPSHTISLQHTHTHTLTYTFHQVPHTHLWKWIYVLASVTGQ